VLRAALALALTTLAALVAAAPAGACSCAAIPAEQRLADPDVKAAFAGVPTTSRDGKPAGEGGIGATRIYTFDVERVYKGNVGSTIEVEIATDGGTCGFAPRTGEKIGLALTGSPPYSAGICNVVDPEDLERAVSAFPAPLLSGNVAALVAGGFGDDASVASIDTAGRILAYGFGRGGRALSPCPGGGRFVQVDREIVVRATASLRVLARRRSGVTSVASARCLSVDGRTVAVTGDGTSERAAGLVLVRGPQRQVLMRGPQPYAVLGGTFALVATGGEAGNGAVQRLDYATGRMRPLVAAPALPTFLALSPDQRRAAFTEQSVGSSAGDPTNIVTFMTRPGSAAVRRRAVPDTLFGPLVWLGAARLLAIPGEDDADADANSSTTPEKARVFDTALRQLGTLPRWDARSFANVGTRLLSLDGSGRLYAASPAAQTVDMVRVLPVSGTATITAVPQRPGVSGASQQVPKRAAPTAQEARARAARAPSKKGLQKWCRKVD
jgi:hypothetical protein